MTTVIRDSIADGSLVLWHDYRAGHMNDLSGNGNDGTPTSVAWAGREGVAFPFSTSVITVADSAELQVTAYTAVALLRCRSQVSYEYLISKFDAGGVNYAVQFYSSGGDKVADYDGAGTRSLIYNVTGSRMVALDTANGETGKVYQNGVYIGDLNTASATAVNDAPVKIGNRYDNGYRLRSHLEAILLWNKRLTATEHASVYSELHEYGGPS